MTFRRLVVSVAFLAVLTMAVRVSVDTDTWWHLRAGAWMVEHRQVLMSDPFSLTRAGQPWVDPSWLAEMAMYAVYSLAGFAGLNLFTAAMVVAAFACVWPLLEGPGILKAFVMLLAAAASAIFWSARPQIVSFALAGAFLLALERARLGSRRWLWALPPLMALWANVHGGFAIGFMLIASYLAGECLEMLAAWGTGAGSLAETWRRRRPLIVGLALAGLGSGAAAALNPHGPALLLLPFRTVSIGVLQTYIQEWQSPDFHRLAVQPFAWMLLLTLAALAWSPRPKRAVEVILVAGFAYLALLASRNVALFALAAAPVLSRHTAAAIEPALTLRGRRRQVPERTARVVNALLLGLLAVAALARMAGPLSEAENQAAIGTQAPVRAVAFIQARRPPGPLLNSYNWGGYVLWALYPDYPSFVDGRTDLFDDAILTDYLAAWRGDPGWETLFDRWQLRLALLEPQAPLVRALRGAGWVELYADDQAVVLARSAGT